jgi:hypothetical protein
MEWAESQLAPAHMPLIARAAVQATCGSGCQQHRPGRYRIMQQPTSAPPINSLPVSLQKGSRERH